MSDAVSATEATAAVPMPDVTPPDAPAVAPGVVETDVVAPVDAVAGQVLAPVVAEAPPVAESAPFVLPTDSLSELAQAAGLEWVQSDAEKVRTVQAAIAAEPKPVHVPREIVRIVLPDEGPLVLVETRRDLANVKLPFEQV